MSTEHWQLQNNIKKQLRDSRQNKYRIIFSLDSDWMNTQTTICTDGPMFWRMFYGSGKRQSG